MNLIISNYFLLCADAATRNGVLIGTIMGVGGFLVVGALAGVYIFRKKNKTKGNMLLTFTFIRVNRSQPSYNYRRIKIEIVALSI